MHGDSVGAETLRRSLADWLTDMGLVSAFRMAEADGYVADPNGEKPSDLPDQLVTRVEPFNRKAAKILGLEFSPSLIGGADEVIE